MKKEQWQKNSIIIAFALVFIGAVLLSVRFFQQERTPEESTATIPVSDQSVEEQEDEEEEIINRNALAQSYVIGDGVYRQLDTGVQVRIPESWRVDGARTTDMRLVLVHPELKIDARQEIPASIVVSFDTRLGYPAYTGPVQTEAITVLGEPLVITHFFDNRGPEGALFHASVTTFESDRVSFVAFLETHTLDMYEQHVDEFIAMLESIVVL